MTDLSACSGEELKRTASICNRRGLHARAAAKFVKLAATFDAQVHVAHRGTEVSGLSIMGLMMLAAAPGCSVELRAEGTQAAAALEALCGLIAKKFDEED
ncbi:HPr family phosphocarrier protein [Magnetospirillum aberrantis]|uniref:HPr family phosphocarrier protein n=1 Tax=Magnetospirillum aberrantis SpK TaxID=908842 RepID=A0A7C9UZM8_9PROT|nr:HPr family phosphocarrier protein [Magnetospirillum aberrantis]NFV80835.1 HPr family phosphocarrier protein [Magnetospirillum aberrantis SpK]